MALGTGHRPVKGLGKVTEVKTLLVLELLTGVGDAKGPSAGRGDDLTVVDGVDDCAFSPPETRGLHCRRPYC